MDMNDLTQALAERVPGWEYWVWPAPEGWVAIALDNPATQYANKTAATPAGAVRMLNEALREAGK